VTLEKISCAGDEVTLAVRARDEAAARAFAQAVEAELGVVVERRAADSERRTVKKLSSRTT
jgi:hypothetical protein